MSGENMKQRRNWLLALMSVFIVFAISSSDVIVDGVETENSLLLFLSKLASTFWTVNITDIISCFGIYFLLNYGRGEEKKIDLAGVVVSALFSFLYIWCFAYKMTGDTITILGNTYQVVLTVIRLAGFTGLFYGIYTSIYKWMGKKGRSLLGVKGSGQDIIEQETSDMSVPGFNWKMFLFSAGIVLSGWLFYIWMAAPAAVAGDGITQLGQFCSGNVTSHHPPLSTWIMGVLFTIGRSITGNAEFGISLYLIFQAIVAALIMGFCVQYMSRLGLKKSEGYLTALIIGFLPLAGSFAGWYEKDMLYSLFTLLFLVITVELLRIKTLSAKGFVMFAVVGLLCIFLRNNGVYAVVPTAFAIIFFLKDKISKRLMIGALVGFIVLPVVINGPVFGAFGIEKGNVREALSIPMQQMARYMRDYGDDITEEERAELGLFFNDYDVISEVYDPFCADPVKDRVELQKGHTLRWLGTWAKLGLKHPGCYFDAFMCLNYGYLAPTEQNMEASWDMPTGDVVLAQMADLGIDGRQNEVRVQILQKLFYINMVFPFIRYLTMPGIYMWLTIVLLSIVIKHKGREELVILLPNIINLLVCLASPLCNGMRYELPVVLSTPLVMVTVMRMMAGSVNKCL